MNTQQIPEFYNDYMAKPDETLKEHTENVLECCDFMIDYLDRQGKSLDEKEKTIFRTACMFHDIGKMNPLFQERVTSSSRKVFDDQKEIGHNILSFLYLVSKGAAFLGNEGESVEWPFQANLKGLDPSEKTTLYNMVLNHHNYINNYGVLEDKVELVESNYRDTFGNQVGKIKTRIKDRIVDQSKNPDNKYIILSGLLHKCDYAASAHLPVEIENVDLLKRLEKKGYKWNELQKFAQEHANENILIIGSTGLGKTEASLLWQGNRKGFYVLPIRTAINAMYERIKNDFFRLDYQNNLGLLHGDTKMMYLEDAEIENMDTFFLYYELTRNRSFPLTICTPDQIFKFVFQYPGYETDLATFRYSKIIIDEIQAYSPDLLAAIVFGLHKVDLLGGNFAITTATCPPVIRDFLIENKITNQRISLAEGRFLNDKCRHKVKVLDDSLRADDILEFYYRHMEEQSCKILVVVNTVRQAQEIYDELKGNDIEINMLHSKFIAKDRRKKEAQIVKDGKSQCNKKVIWIATQVVEASLDIDFDYLFTEYSDLSALFQRMGRCNRKGLKELSETNVFIYKDIPEALLCKMPANNGTERKGIVYSSLYHLGVDALDNWNKNNDGKEMSELEKVEMIEQYYTTERISSYERNLDNRYARYIKDFAARYERIIALQPGSIQKKDVQVEFRNILTVQALPYTIYENLPEEISNNVDKINTLQDELAATSDKAERNSIKVEIMQCKKEIMDNTLSVSKYEATGGHYQIGKYDKLDITSENYTYDSEIGLRRVKENLGDSIII